MTTTEQTRTGYEIDYRAQGWDSICGQYRRVEVTEITDGIQRDVAYCRHCDHDFTAVHTLPGTVILSDPIYARRLTGSHR